MSIPPEKQGLTPGVLAFASEGPTTYRIFDEWYEEVFAAIKARGLDLHQASRLNIQRKWIKDLDREGGRLGSRKIEDVLAALVDAYQFRSVLKVASQRPDDPLFEAKLAKSLKGAAEFLSQYNDDGRDTQFELFTLSSLRSDLKPSLHEKAGRKSADIVLPELGVAIEAKRPKSTNQLWNKIKDGVDQVGSSANIGAVATELTALFSHSYPPTAEEYQTAGPRLAQILERRMLDEIERQKKRRPQWDPGAVKVWSGCVNCFFDVKGSLMGPIGCWVHIGLSDDEAGEANENLVAQAFAHPASYSFSFFETG